MHTKKGVIIGPFLSNVGFYILKVNDTRSASPSTSITEVHARHILLKPSVIMSDEQARTKLTKIAKKIKSNHAKFYNEAIKISQDPSSALQGGDLGWVSPDLYDPAFRSALLKLKKGEISAPLHSAFGWHLIQLLDKRQINTTDAAQKNHAYRILFNRKFIEESNAWMQELRAQAYVKILDAHT